MGMKHAVISVRIATLVLIYFLVGGLPASLCGQSELTSPPNILLICVDDLRPEIAAYGADYVISPNMDRLAATGRAFRRHYVNAPSCGPSRFTLLTGLYGPTDNMAIFARAQALEAGTTTVPPSMPEWFRRHGYRTVSVGKVSHHPGGLGGPDWDDPAEVEMPGAWDTALMPNDEWQHPHGSMHGLANGEIRTAVPQSTDVMQAAEVDDSGYPDGRITTVGLEQLDELAGSERPFFLAVGLIKPHLPFGAPRRYLELYEDVEIPPPANPEQPVGTSTWHGSGEFRRYRVSGDPLTDPLLADSLRRHYAACVSYVDANVGKLLDRLALTGLDRNTIVVLWGDHGWNLGNHAIWGKHNLFEEALHSPLIVSYPGLSEPGEQTEALVETVSIFPTLCELTGVPVPDFVHGASFAELLEDPGGEGDPAAVGYYQEARTIRTDRYRLIAHPDGAYELYDHTADAHELVNLAALRPEVVGALSALLDRQLAPRIVNY